MSRRISSGATFKWLGDELLADLMDYCACHGDMSLTWAAKRAVQLFIDAELEDAQKFAAFSERRKIRLGLEGQQKVEPLPRRKK